MRKAEKECERFNNTVQVGDFVEYSEVRGDPPQGVFKTRTQAQVLSGHTAVVWLEGKAGCVCVSHCRKVLP
jgi:hypothetical protein